MEHIKKISQSRKKNFLEASENKKTFKIELIPKNSKFRHISGLLLVDRLLFNSAHLGTLNTFRVRSSASRCSVAVSKWAVSVHNASVEWHCRIVMRVLATGRSRNRLCRRLWNKWVFSFKKIYVLTSETHKIRSILPVFIVFYSFLAQIP